MASPHYDDGYADGAAAHPTHRGVEAYLKLLGYGLLLLWWVCYYGLLYSPLLFLGYLVMHALPGVHHGNPYVQAGLIGGVAYLAYCTLFFLKGLLLGLRQQGRSGWVLLLVPCLVLACGVPLVVMHLLLSNWWSSLPSFWTWVGGLAFAGLVYQRYQFTTPGAPPVAAWAYQGGLALLQQPRTSRTNHSS